MFLIDIGANLTNRRFDADLEHVIQRAQSAGVGHVLVTGTSVRASQDAVTLAQRFPGYLSATAGVHPHDAKSWNDASADQVKQLASLASVVAVGECGLDFNRDFSPRDQQLMCFEAQLKLACEVQKPVFLHQRDAHSAFVERLRAYRASLAGAVVHCFTGSRAEMEEYVELDCYIGITGWLCDERRGQELRDLVQYIPQDRLLIETDAPYLAPHNLNPRPKGNRNEPAFLPTVLHTLAQLCGADREALALSVTANTYRLFGALQK